MLYHPKELRICLSLTILPKEHIGATNPKRTNSQTAAAEKGLSSIHSSIPRSLRNITSINMKFTAATALAVIGFAAAAPAELAERQSCPKVYIFGARETTVPQSSPYGTAGGLVNQVKAAYPGAGSEGIVYPACGGGSACGGISYDNSAAQGTAAVVKAVTAYNQKCPSTQIVLIGYSQVCH